MVKEAEIDPIGPSRFVKTFLRVHVIVPPPSHLGLHLRAGGSVCTVSARLHLRADGSGVGVEIRLSASLGVPQQGAVHGRQRHGQGLVLIVSGHVGDACATVVDLVGGADVEGRVMGRAGGAVTSLPPRSFGALGGPGRFWRRQGQRGGHRAVQARDAAGIAGKALLGDGGAVRAILLTAVILPKDTQLLVQNRHRTVIQTNK